MKNMSSEMRAWHIEKMRQCQWGYENHDAGLDPELFLCSHCDTRERLARLTAVRVVQDTMRRAPYPVRAGASNVKRANVCSRSCGRWTLKTFAGLRALLRTTILEITRSYIDSIAVS